MEVGGEIEGESDCESNCWLRDRVRVKKWNAVCDAARCRLGNCH